MAGLRSDASDWSLPLALFSAVCVQCLPAADLRIYTTGGAARIVVEEKVASPFRSELSQTHPV